MVDRRCRRDGTRAQAHADTPTTAHFDALGRPFLTVARNRVVCTGHDLDGSEESFATRVELDIEGNQRAVRDERKLPVNYLPAGALEQRIVMRYAYDMLGNRIHQLSMEAGARWMLNDVAGKPIRAWDSRGHNFTTNYDKLRRPVEQTVRGTIANGQAASDPRTLNRDILVDKMEYGEPPGNASQAELDRALRLNLRTRIYRHFDSAGVATNARLDANGSPIEAYDFKGNLLHSTRRLARDYTAVPDWLLPTEPQLDGESFEGATRYDALNRPIQSVAPHSNLTRAQHPNKINVIQPVFNEANLLERVDVWLERPSEPTKLLDRKDPNDGPPSPVGVANIDYDAKGQRLRIDYKTQDTTVIRTSYAYDPETFRLTHLYTRRGVDPATEHGVSFTEDCENPDTPPPDTIAAPETPPVGKACGLQNLHYTYDPAGNITHIQDDAQQTIYFRNQRVEPSNDYTYDAVYRLIQASGREHLGQGGAPIPHSYNDAGRAGILSANPPGRFAANDVAAMGTYIERYVYDAVGNFLQMQHARTDTAVAGWTRRYNYVEDSLIEPAKFSNRLSSTTVGTQPDEVYAHNAHGNMLRMPQLAEMQWDYKDQLRLTRRQRVNDEDIEGRDHDGERTFYVYDAAGQRIRKVCEKAQGLTEERIYLGGFEIFRKHGGPIGASSATLERETLHVMDDKQRIALVEIRTFPATQDPSDPLLLIRYQSGNHLGSASLELDERAQIISYEEYAPYGSTTYQAVRSQTETAKRYRYSGKERDEESGLYYYGARFYAAWIGRWTACDQTASLNRYLFVGACPSMSFDIGGLKSNRELMGLDDASINAALEADPSLSNVIALTAKQSAYDLWNGVTAGFVAKHDSLFEAREEGKLSESDYWLRTTGEAGKSVLVTAASAATGGVGGAGARTLAGQLARGVVTGATTGAAIETGAQGIEMAIGTREKLDGGSIAVAGAGGGVFGMLGAGPAAMVALKRLVGKKLGPKDFGVNFIKNDPKLLKMWEDAVDATFNSNRKKPNALKMLVAKLEKGEAVTAKELNAAFTNVNKKFTEAARKAGYDIAEVHHWNYPKIDNLDNLLDPARLVPAPTTQVHDFMHEATSTAFWPSDKLAVPPPQRAPIAASQYIE